MQDRTRIFRWGALLWKRLYRKMTFLMLLLMIPLLVLGYGMVSQEESGILTVALASEASLPDPVTEQVMADLMDSQLILFVPCHSAAAAREMVQNGEANAAWIFAEDLETKIFEFVANRTRKNAFVTVVEPERSVPLLLVREMLSGTLFSHCSEALYLTYIRENAPELAELSDQQLLEYYYSIELEEGLFAFMDVEGNPTDPERAEQSYLLAPVRGMLAVLIVLAGLGSAMYYIRDMENGTFSWIAEHKRFWVELGCQMICTVNVTAAVLLSLGLSHQMVSLGRELLSGAIYSLCVAAFGMTVRRLTGGLRGLSMVTPLFVVVMLVICPVFFDLGSMRYLQLMFPPTYFVNSIYNSNYLLYMLVYTAVLLVICWLLDRIRRK